MFDFSQPLKFANKINVNLDGDFLLKISRSNNEFDYINLIKCKSDNFKKTITKNLIEIISEDAQKEGADDFSNFRSSVEKRKGVISNISAFILDAIDYKEKKESSKNPIELELLLREGVEDLNLSINSRNLNLVVHKLSVRSIIVNSGNLKFNQEDMRSDYIDVKAGNLSGVFLFDEKNKHLKLRGSNGKIAIKKPSDFFGFVEISGNNIKVAGNKFQGDKRNGFFDVSLNNGNIAFEEN